MAIKILGNTVLQYSGQGNSDNTSIAVGYGALLSVSSTSSLNTAVGYQSLHSDTTGIQNTAVGYQSLYSNTTGSYNTAIGLQSLYSNTTGSGNTAIGIDALLYNTAGNQNTAVGFQSLYSNTTGSYNTSVGLQSLYSNTTGYNNTAIGYQSLYSNTTGLYNTAIGLQSLYSNTTGLYNTAIGYLSLYSNITGKQNIAIGYNSGYSITTGSYNVIVGSYTGATAPISGTGNNYIVLSDGAGNVRQVIDGAGCVTKPYQPAFFASGTGGTITVSTGSYIPFNTLYTAFAGSNRNGGFNTSTYLYTAPVAGLYQFYVQIYLNPSSTTNSLTWWKNGAQMSFADAAQAIFMNTNSSTTPSAIVLSGAVIMELAASDYVGLQVRTSYGSVSMYMGHSAFWGYLVA
jgi:C1q domain